MLKRETILAIFIAVTALVVAVARPTLPASYEPRTLTISASGEYYSLADSAYIDVELREIDLAPENIEQGLQSLMDKIEAIEIQPIYGFTTNLNAYDPNPQDELPGYTLFYNHRIIVHDLTVIDELLGTLAENLLVSSYRVNFITPNTAETRQHAIDNALENALNTAQHLAAETGDTIGEMLELEIGNTYYGSNPDSLNYNHANLATEVESDEMIVRPSLTRTNVGVTVTFELK